MSIFISNKDTDRV